MQTNQKLTKEQVVLITLLPPVNTMRALSLQSSYRNEKVY